MLLTVPGLALFCGGHVRGKSLPNTRLMSIAALGVAGAPWILLGCSRAFAPGRAWVGGLSCTGLRGVRGAPDAIHAGTTRHLLFLVR